MIDHNHYWPKLLVSETSLVMKKLTKFMWTVGESEEHSLRNNQVILANTSVLTVLYYCHHWNDFLYSWEKIVHYENCGYIPGVFNELDEYKANEFNQCLKEMWDHCDVLHDFESLKQF